MFERVPFKAKIIAVVIMVMLVSIFIANLASGWLIGRYILQSETNNIETHIQLVRSNIESSIQSTVLMARSLDISLIRIEEVKQLTGFHNITILNSGLAFDANGAIDDENRIRELNELAATMRSDFLLSDVIHADVPIVRIVIKRTEFQTDFYDINLEPLLVLLDSSSGASSFFELIDASGHQVFSNLAPGDHQKISGQIDLYGKVWHFNGYINQQYIDDRVSDLKTSITYALLVVAVVLIVLSIISIQIAFKPMLKLRAVIRDLSQGDANLTQRLDVKVQDDIGIISTDINSFLEKLQNLIRQVASASHSVESQVELFKNRTENTQALLNSHADETDQIATAITEMGLSANSAADSARATATLTANTTKQAEDSKQIVATAVTSVRALVEQVDSMSDLFNKLNENADEIGSIAEVIGSIAEQTNLLALNAAIEAARAGEQGRGFAVVADEVRALASRTQASTAEINEMLGRLRQGTGNIVSAMDATRQTGQTAADHTEEVGTVLNSMLSAIEEINNYTAIISDASNEQNMASQEVSANMESIRQVVEQLKEQGEESQQSILHLVQTYEQLVNVVARFTLE